MPRTHKAFTVDAFFLLLSRCSFNQAIIAVGKLIHGHLSTVAQAVIILTISKKHHVVLKQNFKIEHLFPQRGFSASSLH